MDKSLDPVLWLKEFSKSWVNIISDEVVYFEQDFRGDSRDVIGFNKRTYIKAYIESQLWFEILIKIRRRNELDVYVALIEAEETVDKVRSRMRQPRGEDNLRHVWHDQTMFVNVINSAKQPKRVFSPLPVRSVIRLYHVDVNPSILAKFFEFTDEIVVTLNVDWETCPFIGFNGNTPSNIVKGGTQAVGNFTHEKPPTHGEGFGEIRIQDIVSILRVSINKASASVTCEEGLDFSVEDVKVLLRPIDSSEGISHWLHMLYSNHEGKEDAENTKGTRDSRTHQRRVSGQPQESRQALNSSPLAQVAS